MSSIAIVGKPNSGKSLLFNQMTGLSQKVANFSGATVEVKSGTVGEKQLIDFPGIYTFNAVTSDEKLSIEKFMEQLRSSQAGAVLCVVDATQLKASLQVGLEVQAMAKSYQIPVIFALNMMDVIQNHGLRMDAEGLSRELGAPVIPVSARTGYGMDQLRALIASAEQIQVPSKEVKNFYERAQELNRRFGPNTEVLVRHQSRLDGFFLSGLWGTLAFIGIMLLLFQSIFTWAVPFMDFVEWMISSLGQVTAQALPKGVGRDFVVDALFGGIGSFLVFVPQIFFLTLLVGVLEDSGYLARAAVICHRPLQLFGLSGKSFIPYLSGHACAIPAIFAARNMDSPKKRLLTILTLPLMSCSARLPVYALLIAACIPPVTFLGGLIGLQGITFFALYAFGLLVALFVSLLLSKSTHRKSSDYPFVIELPPYRVPHWKPLLRKSLTSSWHFITKAGVIIFTVTVVVWILGYFPGGSGQLGSSWLSYLGKNIQPLLDPLGLDWKYGVAILASFLAREVFVGTLGTLFGIEGADEDIAGLADNVQASGLTLGSGIALLVFYVVALQCVSTLAVLKKELGSYRIPVFLFIGYGLLAYLLALCTKWLLG